MFTSRTNNRISSWAAALGSAVMLASCVHEPPIGPEVVDNGNGGGGGTYTGVPCDSGVVYFNQQVLPILISNCAVPGCHNTPTDDNDWLQITSYSTLMSSGKVQDGDFWEALTETDPDDVMPPPEQPGLSPAQLALIQQWLQQGAQDLNCDSYAGGCDTTNVTYSIRIQPLVAAKCQGCHSGANPQGGLNFTAWSVLNTVALDGRLMGAVQHQPDYVAMPPSGAMLPQCEIDMLADWVQQGAPQN